ncbi:thioesterase family protein [Guptibacillus algicola]|uniref:thioesterase family protein n=1 Tax=Guptibacillus algicola TaxID=225844 RepID=UPI001CD2E1C3|nr:thioesterase family protein [Alkalihalobacillus algicola]MCA0988624.1 thioesterase family protein [Alkalihalobacillus algicola]
MKPSFKLEQKVLNEWVDYNGHMNDAEYAKVFSIAVDEFMNYIGLHEEAREKYSYTIFTLETHLCYLKEAHEGEKLIVTSQLLDIDQKRIHIFFMMSNEQGDLVATSEQMLMGMDTTEGRPGAFPEAVGVELERLYLMDKENEKPKHAGRTIGIKRKKD